MECQLCPDFSFYNLFDLTNCFKRVSSKLIPILDLKVCKIESKLERKT